MSCSAAEMLGLLIAANPPRTGAMGLAVAVGAGLLSFSAFAELAICGGFSASTPPLRERAPIIMIFRHFIISNLV